MVELLLRGVGRFKADIHAWNESPLKLAVQANSRAMVEVLLHRGGGAPSTPPFLVSSGMQGGMIVNNCPGNLGGGVEGDLPSRNVLLLRAAAAARPTDRHPR